MITAEMLCVHLTGLQPEDLQRWTENAWVRPAGRPGQYLFDDVDVARVRLLVELRDVMGIDEDALPVVLLLLDQLYHVRREARRLADAIDETVPDDVRQALLQRFVS